MNKKETRRIADELKKIGFKLSNSKSKILWFATKEYSGPQEIRNKEKNLCKLVPYFSVSFLAEVNKNGVGDGKKPDPALTYQIDFCNPGSIRMYREKSFYPAEHFKFFDYSRGLKDLIEKFKTHLTYIGL